jgi:uncharacterized damage-inducible protein DinB
MTAPILALRDHLEGLRDLLVTIPEDSYRTSPARASGSVGAHVRHCLDHATALLSCSAGGELCYDTRRRGTAVETDVRAAMREIKRLHLALSDLDPSHLDEPLTLRSMTRRDGGSIFVKTTVGRELAFVLQHTIHHCAMIGLLLEQVGIAVPMQFGYAPSTPVN